MGGELRGAANRQKDIRDRWGTFPRKISEIGATVQKLWKLAKSTPEKGGYWVWGNTYLAPNASSMNAFVGGQPH